MPGLAPSPGTTPLALLWRVLRQSSIAWSMLAPMTGRCTPSMLPHVLLSRSYKSLCCDKDTTNKHHTCTKQTFSYVTFVEEHTCPDNREDGTQVEERCHVPDQAQRNRREAKE